MSHNYPYAASFSGFRRKTRSIEWFSEGKTGCITVSELPNGQNLLFRIATDWVLLITRFPPREIRVQLTYIRTVIKGTLSGDGLMVEISITSAINGEGVRRLAQSDPGCRFPRPKFT